MSNTLREWGLDASALAGTAELLAANSRWEYEGLPYVPAGKPSKWLTLSATRVLEWWDGARDAT